MHLKYLISLLTIFLCSCNQNNNDEKFIDGNHVLHLNTFNNGKTIKWNEPFVVLLKFKNIDLSKNKLSITGPNAHAKYISDNEIEIEMLKNKESSNKEEVKNGIVYLIVGFINEQNKNIEHNFPIKLDQ